MPLTQGIPIVKNILINIFLHIKHDIELFIALPQITVCFFSFRGGRGGWVGMWIYHKCISRKEARQHYAVKIHKYAVVLLCKTPTGFPSLLLKLMYLSCIHSVWFCWFQIWMVQMYIQYNSYIPILRRIVQDTISFGGLFGAAVNKQKILDSNLFRSQQGS